MPYAAYIENCRGPIAMAETRSKCLEISLHRIVQCVNDPLIGKACRELLEGEIGDVKSPKLRITEYNI